MASNYLMWFRQDLRVLDNTALAACCEAASEQQTGVLAVFYLTPIQWQSHHKSLWQIDLMLRQIEDLTQNLAKLYIGLVVRTVADFAEQAEDIVRLCHDQGITQVFANREYLVNEERRDHQVTAKAQPLGIQIQWHDDSTIIAPQRITTDKGQAYKVFTPFYKRWLALLETTGLSVAEYPTPLNINTTALAKRLSHQKQALTLDDFYVQFYQAKPYLDQQLQQIKTLSETLYPATKAAAMARLEQFVMADIEQYNTARDVPSLYDNLGATSRLSPYLAVGMVSPRVCYLKAVDKLPHSLGQEQDIYRWLSELAWRDFYVDVIVNRPDIVKGQAFLQPVDKAVAWRYDQDDFVAWCQGKTGVPLVDAAMRCLNATGFMHNRLRMVVAMYLTKNLLIDWRWGEVYFIQHLVDGDFASNNGGWQWSASVGTDAQPYFRVMNPFSQAQTHDSEAVFIKHWLPELAKVPAAILHNEPKLQSYLKSHPAIDYPQLTLPTKVTRAEAIAAFKQSR